MKYSSFLVKCKCMIGECFKLGFSRVYVFHFFTWTFFWDFNLQTFSLQCSSCYYEITLQREMDQLLWWAVVLPVIFYSTNHLRWGSQVILVAHLPWLSKCTLVLQWRSEHRARKALGTLVRGQDQHRKWPLPQMKCISFPLEWIHKKAKREMALVIFSVCFVILYFFEDLCVCVWENLYRIFSCVLDI